MKSAGIISIVLFTMLSASPTLSASGVQDEFARGQIIEKVVCKSDAMHSYALYLPSTYTPAKTWPIIYCFDPAARGAFPLARFKDAAEKYGYIIVGSNNSRNGPDVPLSNIVQTLFQDSSSRLSIDEKRIYTAGFSGGARVACNIGFAYKGIHGVIACGAGFPPQTSPSRSVPFVLFGTAGTEDFNYAEMKDLDEALDNFHITHRVEIFEGGHDWAPAELCRKAIEWMEIQAMKSDRRAKDESLIGELFEKAVSDARSFDSANRKYDAFLAYKAVMEFQGLRDTAEFEKRLAELAETKEVKQAIKDDKEQIAEQKRRAAEIYSLRARLRNRDESAATGDATGIPQTQSGSGPAVPSVSAPTNDIDPRPLIVSDIRRRLNELKKKSEAKEPSPERATARRVLNQYRAYSFETTMILFMSKKYDLAVSHLSVETEIQPDNARLFYNLACAYSLDGNKKKAIDALKKAVQKGYSNLSEITGSEALAPLREEESFQKLVEQIRQESNKTKS